MARKGAVSRSIAHERDTAPLSPRRPKLRPATDRDAEGVAALVDAAYGHYIEVDPDADDAGLCR
jgi:hypothetical protein